MLICDKIYQAVQNDAKSPYFFACIHATVVSTFHKSKISLQKGFLSLLKHTR